MRRAIGSFIYLVGGSALFLVAVSLLCWIAGGEVMP